MHIFIVRTKYSRHSPRLVRGQNICNQSTNSVAKQTWMRRGSFTFDNGLLSQTIREDTEEFHMKARELSIDGPNIQREESMVSLTGCDLASVVVLVFSANFADWVTVSFLFAAMHQSLGSFSQLLSFQSYQDTCMLVDLERAVFPFCLRQRLYFKSSAILSRLS